MTIDKLIEDLLAAHESNPKFNVGQLIENAAKIATATLTANPGAVSDEELAWGLRALVPDPEDGL